MEGNIRSGSTLKVIVTSTDGSVKEFFNKKYMENVIAKSNEAKYHATEGGSQLHQKDFTDRLGTHGEGPNINEVLDGTFIYPSSCSQDTEDFLDNYQYDNKSHTIKENSSGKYQYRAYFKSWLVRRDSTCSYGQHVGHYKAVLKYPS